MAAICNLLSWLDPIDENPFALVCLNTGQSMEMDRFEELWRNASFIAVVDGAINAIHQSSPEKATTIIPHLITGDFDSAEPDILNYYRQKGTEVICTPSQDDTDFTKCLKLVGQKIDNGHIQVNHIVVIDSFAGRLDHIMSNINTLYLAREVIKVPVYLYSGDSMACLLSKGKHCLYVDPGLRGNYVGLIPVGCPARNVTTTGLHWNLNHDELSFGGLVSSSNTYDKTEKHITVDTDQPILWTTTLHSYRKQLKEESKL